MGFKKKKKKAQVGYKDITNQKIKENPFQTIT